MAKRNSLRPRRTDRGTLKPGHAVVAVVRDMENDLRIDVWVRRYTAHWDDATLRHGGPEGYVCRLKQVDATQGIP